MLFVCVALHKGQGWAVADAGVMAWPNQEQSRAIKSNQERGAMAPRGRLRFLCARTTIGTAHELHRERVATGSGDRYFLP